MITVAIIGAGIGHAHLSGYLALPELFCVKTVCDLDTARAEKVIREKAGENTPIQASADLSKVLADDDIDIVDICLPPHLHFTAVRDALQAGKHVVCEKPMVSSLEQADALIELANNTGCIVSPVFQYRFGLAMSQLQALQNSGLTGQPYVASLETHWDRNAAYYDIPWRGTWEGENGGAVLGHAIHNHDLLTSILGPIARLSAHITTRVNDIEVEDCAAISFEMANGSVATSCITLGAASNTSRIRIVFEGLTAESGTEPYAPASDTWTFTARRPEDQARVDQIAASIVNVQEGFEGFFAELAKQINKQNHRAVSIDDGRQSLELVAAVYQASREKRIIELPLDKSTALYDGWAPKKIS